MGCVVLCCVVLCWVGLCCVVLCARSYQGRPKDRERQRSRCIVLRGVSRCVVWCCVRARTKNNQKTESDEGLVVLCCAVCCVVLCGVVCVLVPRTTKRQRATKVSEDRALATISNTTRSTYRPPTAAEGYVCVRESDRATERQRDRETKRHRDTETHTYTRMRAHTHNAHIT